MTEQFSLADFGPLTRDQLKMMARTAESAERYDDMCKFMKQLVASVGSDELSIEERNLLSVAYKNVIGARRASWRTLNVEEHKNTVPGVVARSRPHGHLYVCPPGSRPEVPQTSGG